MLPHYQKKMSKDKLQKDFDKSVEFVNTYSDPFPADILLKLYAYYKVATKNYSSPGSRTPLINAFKANALIQTQNLTAKEAMKKYIDLVNKEVKKNNS